MRDIYNISLLDLLPTNLANDEEIKAFAYALDPEIRELMQLIRLVRIMETLDFQTEGVLLHLLAQNHITGDEGSSLAVTLDEKRNLIRNAKEIHEIKGTTGAIEKVLSLLSMRGEIKEWYEYQGEPFHFQIDIQVTTRGLSDVNIALLERLLKTHKRNSAHLEKINFYLTSDMNTTFTSTMLFGEEVTIYPWNQSEIETKGNYTLGTASQSVETLTIYPQ